MRKNVTESLKENQTLNRRCHVLFHSPQEKNHHLRKTLKKIANNKLKQARSTGSMPMASGSIPSRITAFKPSTDQD